MSSLFRAWNIGTGYVELWRGVKGQGSGLGLDMMIRVKDRYLVAGGCVLVEDSQVVLLRHVQVHRRQACHLESRMTHVRHHT